MNSKQSRSFVEIEIVLPEKNCVRIKTTGVEKPHKISKIWRQQIFLSFSPTIGKREKGKKKSELLFGDFLVCLWNRNGCWNVKHKPNRSEFTWQSFFGVPKFLFYKTFREKYVKFDSNKLMAKETARVYFSTQTFYEMENIFSQAIKFRAPVNVWEIIVGGERTSGKFIKR